MKPILYSNSMQAFAVTNNSVFWKVTLYALNRTDVSKERIASINRVERINELGTTLAVTSN
jgi:hypothetical protein